MSRLLLLVILTGLLFSGCYSTSSLDRGRRNRAQIRKKSPAAPPRVKRNKGESDDPAFDLIFGRKPQKHEASSLNSSESEWMRRSAAEDAEAVRSVRRERMKNDSGQKDWVFGTKNGDYFGR